MIKTITLNINFIAEGNVKKYARVIENFGASDFPTIKEFIVRVEEVLKELNVSVEKTGNTEL